MAVEVDWVKVAGGICSYGDSPGRPVAVGDLWWTRTVLTCGQVRGVGAEVPAGVDALLPWTSADHAAATRIAGAMGGRLPWSVEWEWMAAGPLRRRYPWGEQLWSPQRANLRGSGCGRALPVGSLPAGRSPDGLLDVAGNVWEWTASPVLGGGAVVRGGSYNSLPVYALCGFVNAVPRSLRSPGIGVRIVRDP
jgi:iron(II)-dependent oxidoreductase